MQWVTHHNLREDHSINLFPAGSTEVAAPVVVAPDGATVRGWQGWDKREGEVGGKGDNVGRRSTRKDKAARRSRNLFSCGTFRYIRRKEWPVTRRQKETQAAEVRTGRLGWECGGISPPIARRGLAARPFPGVEDGARAHPPRRRPSRRRNRKP